MSSIKGSLAVAIGVIMLLSSLVVVLGPGQSPAEFQQGSSGSVDMLAETAPFTAVSLQQNPLTGNTIKNTLEELSIPDKYAYLPNLAYASPGDQVVAPLYASSPAPMGVVDYGLMESSGVQIPYTYTTSSFEGTAMFEALDPLYLMNSDPQSVSIQLSAVLSGVTINGHGGYSYWVKNVMYYTPSTGQVTLIDNIWNLSSTEMIMPQGTVQSGSGQIASSMFYYYAGPELNLNGSFTMGLYLTSGLYDGNNAVYFGYSISGTEMNQTAAQTTFDTVVFNSKSTGSTESVSNALFKIDGFHKTPSGLLYDAELVLGGPGGGSMTSIYAANGQFNLKFLSAGSSYTKLPAAYNFGSNTAETAQGISSWWTSTQKPLDHLSAGPSLLVPLWGSDVTHSGATNIQGYIEPPNAFVFMSIGTSLDNETAAWGPLNETGYFIYSLPGAISYSGVVMLDGYLPSYFYILGETENETENETGHEPGGHGGHGPPDGMGGGGGSEMGGNETATWINITLEPAVSSLLYTPLYVSSDDQLEYLASETESIVSSGNGTDENPYIINIPSTITLNTLFTSTNSYLYPAFAGMLFMNTASNVMIVEPPLFQLHYPNSMLKFLDRMNLPSTNYLNYIFYKTDGITFEHGKGITGWTADTVTTASIANVQFINSHDFLVSRNTFNSMGASLLVYNSPGDSGGGVIWGNHFMQSLIVSSHFAEHIQSATNPVGLYMFSSGNMIYNNYFAVSNPAVSPGVNPYDGSAASYSNNWNLPQKEPSSYVYRFHGMHLSGSVVDSGYQGGNFWLMHNDATPYNASGNIVLGGDFEPLVIPEHTVSFNSVGLPEGTSWSVTFNGVTQSSTGSVISFSAADGSYTFEIQKPSTYMADPVRGQVVVYGLDVVQAINFAPVTYNVNLVASGLTGGTSWGVIVAGHPFTSTSSTITVPLHNGSYDYSIIAPDGYTSDISTGTLIVYGSSVTVPIVLSEKTYALTFVANGLPSGKVWTINFDGINYNATSGYITLNVANGNHTYFVPDVDGYDMDADNGYVVVSDQNHTVNFQFSQSPNYWNITILLLIGIAAGIVAVVALTYLLRKR